jgi:hypothetical protein
MSGAGRATFALFLAALGPASGAQPAEACYVRIEPAAPASIPLASDVVSSHIGIRRNRAQLFDVDISLSLPSGANCSISGIARLRGTRGQEVLAFPLRRDASLPPSPTGTPCQVFVQLTPTALVLATTEQACAAQPPCEGVIPVNGQRFDLTGKVAPGTRGPCFARTGP